MDAEVRAASRAALIDGFKSLVSRDRLTRFLEQPLGAAVFLFACRDAAAVPPTTWSGLFDAVGGPAAAAMDLKAAALHLPQAAALQANNLAVALLAGKPPPID